MRFLLPTRARKPQGRSGRARTAPALGSVLLLALAHLVNPASATSVRLQGTADLVENANTVVIGRVVSTEARMREDHQFIYTYVTLEVEDVIKGHTARAGRTIVLEELGGQVDDWIHFVEAVPSYAPGERVLAFLEDREDGYYRTWGMVQGKFTFEADVRSGAEVLTRPQEWTDAFFAVSEVPRDLTVVRADGSYAAAPLLTAIRDWVARN